MSSLQINYQELYFTCHLIDAAFAPIQVLIIIISNILFPD